MQKCSCRAKIYFCLSLSLGGYMMSPIRRFGERGVAGIRLSLRLPMIKHHTFPAKPAPYFEIEVGML